MFKCVAAHGAVLVALIMRYLPAPHVKQPVITRRLRESLDNFSALRRRLDKENQLHALMLSQRIFRSNSR